MPKITSVESQKRNPHRFNVFLDRQFAFGADEDLVVEYRLISGKIIDQTLVEKLLFEAEVGKLMERMYRLWNIRPRSEKEVRSYLRSLSFKRKIKGKEEISDQATELLINKLKHKRLLSDEEFAKAWVEVRLSKIGPRALKQELFQKGIDRETIAGVISDKGQVISQKETASQLLEKKMNIWKNLPGLKKKKKAYEFLLRRGFEYEVVRAVIENLIKRG